MIFMCFGVIYSGENNVCGVITEFIFTLKLRADCNSIFKSASWQTHAGQAEKYA